MAKDAAQFQEGLRPQFFLQQFRSEAQCEHAPRKFPRSRPAAGNRRRNAPSSSG